ncbi:hypothetical protein BaRGS_00006624 [Batillaria attramentaria]|uniref:Mediator of RNA polymerase II transcription subunit 8 n=1 Tax=Batillaria attramentaria TaxID=370345 RepID=A0ABD0LSJ6_9CAEN
MYIFKVSCTLVNRPSALDNFALLSGQLNSLKQLLKGDKMPPLRNYVLFPVLLSQDADPHLEKLTEGRVMSCNHDLVPDYLRTKPEPEVEEKIQTLSNKAATISTETNTKQLNSLNKITSNLLDIINSAKDEWENDASQKGAQPQTSLPQETTNLVGAITKGLRLRRPDTSMQQQQPGQMAPSSQQSQHPKPGGIGKVPSTIKTNIKAAGSSHPYQR